MLESLDGKISTGENDDFDVDEDFIKIDGVKEGLYQYYEIEAETDLFSLNTGRVMAKIGVNKNRNFKEKIPATFVIIDNKPHLEKSGIEYLCRWAQKLILVTINPTHVGFSVQKDFENLEILRYDKLDLKKVLEDLYEKFGAEKLTIQSGGNLNGLFLREDLIDFVHVVIAPILIGGTKVPTLIDGAAIKDRNELEKLRTLDLIECKKLKNSYLELRYKVRRN